MRWSRWGRSSYEREHHLAAEAAAMSAIVEVAPPGTDAEILSVTSRTRVNASMLDAAPSAKLVITTTSGTDHMDLSELFRRGITWARMPLARRDAVVETALGMLLSGSRRLGSLRAAAAEGRWVRGELPAYGMRLLAGRRVGVIGLGIIGRRMATALDALGVEVWGSDPAGLPPRVTAASIEDMIAECAAITLHCELTPETRGMINRARLEKARGLVLVNTARGNLVDVDAAMEGLEAGRLSALGLDVYPLEPWPRLSAAAERPELMLTPHAAGYHDGLPEALREELVATVERWLKAQGKGV